MTSALDIIEGAAGLIGVTFMGEALPADDAAEGLELLNEMLDSWSNIEFVDPSYTTESFALTSATSYTIGTGGDFNTTRPINIVDAIVRQNDIDSPVTIITQEQYQQQIAYKSVNSPYPKFLTYDNGFPLGTIKLYPAGQTGSTLIIQTNKPISNFATLATTVSMQPGMKKALKTNLAIEMAPYYGMPISADLYRSAAQSLGAVRSANLSNNAFPFMGGNISQSSYLAIVSDGI